MGCALQSLFIVETMWQILTKETSAQMPGICCMVLITQQGTQLGVIFIALHSVTTARKAAWTAQSKGLHPSISPIRLYHVNSQLST